MNRILDRFAQVEEILAREIRGSDIVLEGERVVFYTPKSSSASGAYGCSIILGGWAVLLVMGLFEWHQCCKIPLETVWIFSVFIIAGTGAMIVSNWRGSRENGAFKQYRLFEIDTTNETIVVQSPGPFYVEREEIVAIAEVYRFYGWHEGSGDSSEDYLHAVDVKDRTTVVCRQFVWSDRWVRLLGFLCDKPAYHRDNRGKITPLANFCDEFVDDK